MSIDKQKLAFLIACMWAGSAFSAVYPMHHVQDGTGCPTAVEKDGKTAVARPDADQGMKAVADDWEARANADSKAGKGPVLNTQFDSARGGSATGGGGAGKAPAASVPGQKSAPTAQ
jgi:hypothetical protein